jgi:hypothetical protein
MPKFTRRIKENIKNKTYKTTDIFGKKGGDTPNQERKGIIDIATDKMSDAASFVFKEVEDVGLNALGLERINKSNNFSQEDDEKIGESASGMVSAVGNTVNKTSSAVINNVNNVLGSESISNSVGDAAKKTAEIAGNLADKFNNAMDNPEIKKKVEKAIDYAGDIGEIVVKSSEKPLKEAIRVGVEAGSEAIGATSSGAVRVITDIAAAVPVIGGIIDLAKAFNDGSRAASAVVEAGSEAVETASDAFIETTKNIKQGIKELEEKKNLSDKISNRTTQSINNFENPLPNTVQAAGRRRTKRRLFKRKAKSKRVRFVI